MLGLYGLWSGNQENRTEAKARATENTFSDKTDLKSFIMV